MPPTLPPSPAQPGLSGRPRLGAEADLGPAQQTFLETMTRTLDPFGVEDVQRWDETRTPPLEVLRAALATGLYAALVPIPPIEEALPLLEDPTLAPCLGEEAIRRLRDLPGQPGHQERQELLARLQEEGSALPMSLLCAETARKTGVGVGTFLGVSNGLVAQALDKIATPAQRSLWLHALNQGLFTYGFALSEEQIGSDPRSIQTRYRREVDASGRVTYRLSGNKKWIGNAARVLDAQGQVVHPGADFLCVLAVEDPGRPPSQREFRAFMVPRGLIGEDRIRPSGGEHNKLGLREVNNGNFDLDGVVLPASLMLGLPEEDVYRKLLGLLDITRLFVGAMGLGSAQASLEIARRYAAERQQGGAPIERFQAVSFPLDLLEAKIAATSLLVVEASRRVDRAERQRRELDAEIGAPLQAEILRRFGVELPLHDCWRLVDLAPARPRKGTRRPSGPRYAPFEAALRRLLAERLHPGPQPPTEPPALPIPEALVGLASTLREARRRELRVGLETAMAKLYASELAEEAAQVAITTLGGNGFVEDPREGRGLPKRRRDARVLTIYEGTSYINRNVISGSICIQAAKKAGQSLRTGIRYLLLQSPLTRRAQYRVLRDTSRTPLERVNAAYQYAVTGVLGRYREALKELVRAWKRDGVPPAFATWGSQDLERQQNLMATLPVQQRLQLVADLATWRELLRLALRQLELPTQGDPAEARLRQRLELFVPLAEEAVIRLGRELGSRTLAALEARDRRRRAGPG